MQDFKKLEVWKLSFELGKEIYKITSNFPKEEIYSITSQLRRSSLSISANIAEGTGKDSDKDFLRFIRISVGSLKETENFILMARDIKFMQPQEAEQLLRKIKIIGIKLINFMKILKQSIKEEVQNRKLNRLARSSATKSQQATDKREADKQQNQRFC